MTAEPTRFDEAWQTALDHAAEAAKGGRDVVVARDLLGRASLLIDDRADRHPVDAAELTALRDDFAAATRPFTGLDPVQTIERRALIKRLNRSGDATMVVPSQYLEVVVTRR